MRRETSSANLGASLWAANGAQATAMAQLELGLNWAGKEGRGGKKPMERVMNPGTHTHAS